VLVKEIVLLGLKHAALWRKSAKHRPYLAFRADGRHAPVPGRSGRDNDFNMLLGKVVNMRFVDFQCAVHITMDVLFPRVSDVYDG